MKPNRLSSGRSGRRLRRALVSSIAAMALLAGAAAPVFADEYDEKMAGHPLRIVAYALHPVGVAIAYLIMRPAHWLVSQEPMKTIFGHED